MLNSKALNALLCSLSKEEYTKVHSFKSEKQMWDTLAITYEGSSNPPRRCSGRRKTKKRASLYIECKNLGHFKSECPELEKSKDKYKHFKSKDKKSLMSTWEDLNDTTSDEEGEE
ncbi:hypothetical protein GYH30_049984 [Glycine max]|uniref:CCHC-type domain-containing protein n=1 Tax=Glycine max TaxID=3847 RepID=A0A0R0EZX4_SOYBN|nr:hypothetical protein GYH30_049984 [Glycine max]